MATDLADYLVKQGGTFREAHGAVGSLVRQAEEAGIELSALPDAAFAAASPRFGADTRASLGADASLAAEIDQASTPSSAAGEASSLTWILKKSPGDILVINPDGAKVRVAAALHDVHADFRCDFVDRSDDAVFRTHRFARGGDCS